ncbi:MAG TPA: lysophospholipid acyltransferase family protein [Planctomycetota bacterium]|jgi:1-acyl-sn-glycerol-3-phosphate acyltransferase|nr:1-acyl-sn-glycerol-3-phosphate acyltransferase [Planctomycetota bacterium]OQC22395.1 MAG: 1-acyl-sn-glycerol-3-phosphate acyltransferase [Planctomycetes bacterium ADurb.Bin069]HNR98858.1 lysophospholipid acyltransferase family protein [Planctomycetota bacterium]HNU26657.1 lysophospholipid acyltransferase family protein [Planctomycetota bacterium]HOE29156.1 lysophospholipid acyltransferase family protein [Planctomycetota bacterium]
MESERRARGGEAEFEVRDPAGPNCLYKSCHAVCAAVMYSYFGLRVRGRGRVPRRGGAVIASNHVSFMDPVAVGIAAPRPIAFLARHSLYRSRGFGRLILGLNAYPLPRENVSTGAIKRALKLLEAGWAILVFPEGTRSPDGALKPFRGGLAFLAAKARVPVIPAAVKGAFEAWPRGRLFPRPGKVTVAFGPLILYDDIHDTYDSFTARVAGAVAALAGQAPASPGTAPGAARS